MIADLSGGGVDAGAVLRVVLVGYGLSGRVFHAPLITHTAGMKLCAVVTGNPERQNQVVREHPAACIIRSSKELSRMADEFDVAVIATPTGTHVREALRAVRSGLHVVVDKPIAGTVADADLLREQALKFDRQVYVFHNRRWDSDFLSVRDLKDTAVLGDLFMLESRMESLRPVRGTSWRNSPNPGDSGGALLDLGSHLVDQALQLMGPVRYVSSRTQALREGAAANDHFSMLLSHEGDSTSLLIASRAQPFAYPRFKVLGSRAAARVDWHDSQESALRDGMNPDSPTWGMEPPSAMARICPTTKEGEWAELLVPAARGAWNTFYSKVFHALMNDGPPPVSMDQAIETQRVLDAARIAAAQGATIALTPPARHSPSIGN